MSIKEEFEKAFEQDDFGQDPESNLIPEEQAALWGAKWMAERCAKHSETSTITIPNESGGSVTMSKDGGHIADEIRQLAKDLE